MLKQFRTCQIVQYIYAKKYAIYVIDYYSVYLMLEIKKAFLKRGYDLVVISGRMTGDIQVNDTNIHFSFKAKNRQLK